jgi:hypothetical protein
MEIIVKKSQHRVDPRHPQSTDPNWGRSFEKGQEMIQSGKLKFNDRGEEEHYWKMVNGNPANVPGLPPFAPPLEIKSYVKVHFNDIPFSERMKWLQKEASIEGAIYCSICDSLTVHVFGDGCFCKKCGTLKPMSGRPL